MSFVDGLSSGLDTSNIIRQLMQIERLPQNRLVNQRTAERSAQTELKAIRGDVSSLGDLASDLRRSTQWQKLTATSTNESVTPTAASGQFEGAFSFSVSSLATAHSVYSNDVYADPSEVGGASGSVFSYRDTAVLGISKLEASGLPIGGVAFEVTQASAGATVSSGPIPTIPVTVDATNDQLGLEVNGVSYQVSLDHGTYDSEQALANALATAIAGNTDLDGVVTSKLDADDHLVLSTVAEGSAHSLQITGGNGADSLGFVAGPAVVGTDGIVSINGQTTTVNDTTLGPIAMQATADPAGPSITVTINGGLRAGTAEAEQIDFASGSLTDIVNTINDASGLNYSAAAINTGNGYRLQLMSRETGTDAVIDADLASIAGVSGFTTLTDGADATLTVEGLNPYTITSSNNDFSDVLPGVDITVSEVTEDPVTITVARDTAFIAEKVGSLVSKVNELIGRIGESTKSTPDGPRSVLQGHRSVRTASDRVTNAMIRPVDASSFGSLGSIGIEIERSGNLKFDEEKFLQAMKDNPAEVTRLFARAVGDDGAEAGVLDRLVSAADGAASFGDGYLFTAAESAGRRIEAFSDQIDAYEIRLELRESTYRRTYANLEVMLGSLQSQSANLGAQLSGLGGGL